MSTLVCEICGRGPFKGGYTIHRANEKGVDAIWRCDAHIERPIDPEHRELLDVLEQWSRSDAEAKP
jgi:hypothetical protein